MRRVATTETTIMAGTLADIIVTPMAAITTGTATVTQTADHATPSTSVDSGMGAQPRLVAPCAIIAMAKVMWSPAAGI